jgi:PiT family inorganic phosphate transporter
VATGSIFGASAGRGVSTVRWAVARRMALAWLLTLPAAAVIGALATQLAASGTAGTVAVTVLAAAVALGIYGVSRRRPVTGDNVNDVPAPVTVLDPAPVERAA